MENLDIAQLKSTLSAYKKQIHSEKASPSPPTAEKAFRRGVQSRLKAADLLGTGLVSHAQPIIIRRAALIAGYRNGVATYDVLGDTHLGPEDNTAWFGSTAKSGGALNNNDRVSFYFPWPNDTGSDAVVNVETVLMINGNCNVFAESGLIWVPLWGTTTSGDVGQTILAELSPLEWWNQPPTEPLRQPAQTYQVHHIYVRARAWQAWSGNPGEQKVEPISGDYFLHYSRFMVPQSETAIFEVSVSSLTLGYKGWSSFGGTVICPYVELEVLTPTLPVGPG
jgi:hypothetical protein